MIGAACLDDGQRSHDHILVTVEDDRNHTSRLDDARDVGGESVSKPVQLRVCQESTLVHDGRMVGVFCGDVPEKVQESQRGIELDRSRIESFHLGQLAFRREGKVSSGVGTFHRCDTSGQTVCKLPQETFGVLVSPVSDGDLVRCTAKNRVRAFGKICSFIGRRFAYAHGKIHFQLGLKLIKTAR